MYDEEAFFSQCNTKHLTDKSVELLYSFYAPNDL